jgi:hypothetical protein
MEECFYDTDTLPKRDEDIYAASIISIGYFIYSVLAILCILDIGYIVEYLVICLFIINILVNGLGWLTISRKANLPLLNMIVCFFMANATFLIVTLLTIPDVCHQIIYTVTSTASGTLAIFLGFLVLPLKDWIGKTAIFFGLANIAVGLFCLMAIFLNKPDLLLPANIGFTALAGLEIIVLFKSSKSFAQTLPEEGFVDFD